MASQSVGWYPVSRGSVCTLTCGVRLFGLAMRSASRTSTLKPAAKQQGVPGTGYAHVRQVQGDPEPEKRAVTRGCRSSVVEHSLGKGEVVCSIHTGSTRTTPPSVFRQRPGAALPRCGPPTKLKARPLSRPDGDVGEPIMGRACFPRRTCPCSDLVPRQRLRKKGRRLRDAPPCGAEATY